MLNEFTETSESDNRPLSTEDAVGNIVRGATCVHLFRLPAAVADIKDYKVSYKQGLAIVLEKSLIDCEIETSDVGTYARVVISPEESRLFSCFYKYALAQTAFLLRDDVTVIYSLTHVIEVIDTVNDDPFIVVEEEI